MRSRASPLLVLVPVLYSDELLARSEQSRARLATKSRLARLLFRGIARVKRVQPKLQLQDHSLFWVVEVEAGKLLDPLQTLGDGVVMDMERTCRSAQRLPRIEVHPQRCGESCPMLVVVASQGSSR